MSLFLLKTFQTEQPKKPEPKVEPEPEQKPEPEPLKEEPQPQAEPEVEPQPEAEPEPEKPQPEVVAPEPAKEPGTHEFLALSVNTLKKCFEICMKAQYGLLIKSDYYHEKS